MHKICDNFYSAISNTVLIVFISLISFNFSFAKSSTYKDQLLKIEQLIEKNQLIAAQKLVKILKHTFKESIQENYYSTKLSCKIFLFQQAFDHYNLANEKLCKLAKQLPPIYLSEAYAHKAYYWHYMMWPDSALVYSNKSYELYNKSRKYKSQIEPAFIYEVYAMTYLYRSDDLKTTAYSGMGLKGYQPKLFLYFDSSYFIQQRYPFKFTSDKAMFYRSNGNRWLDLVTGYRIKTKAETKYFKPVQWLAFRKANELYDKGIACLKEWHRNDLLTLTALKATNYTGVGKWKEAQYFFDRVFNQFSEQELLNRTFIAYQPLMIFLTMKIRNEIHLPINPISTNKSIHLLEKIKYEFWNSFTDNSDLPYDPYRTSPYIDLFTLYTLKSKFSNSKKTDLSKAVSYLLTMKNYFHFLKNKTLFRNKELPFFDVKLIQKKLKHNECFIFFQNDADLLAEKKLLITRNSIQFIRAKKTPDLVALNHDTLNYKAFKKISYLAFQNNLKQVLTILPKVKKIYISHDDIIPYEILLKDNLSSSYTKANFAGNQINFVRLYNPYTYFGSSKELNECQIDVRSLKQKKVSKLLFMDEFFKNFTTTQRISKNDYQGNLKDLLSKKGILHLYGHGEFSMDDEAQTSGFQIRYETTSSTKSERQLSGDFSCKRELVILNNCFSGYPFFNLNEFNKTIPLKILSLGAKTLICSPNKTDDYYSAQFFQLFYKKLTEGRMYEDAFFESKQAFVKAHPEMRNPQIWNGLQLIVSYKIHNKPENQFLLVFNGILILVLLDIILSVLNALLRKKKRLHSLD
ncbi:MAG: CHAT domain-containing protein [Crocinitomicaceae bacterium]|nr:CHAT domain-containing protein [Crocinitomicaceae bacterium]